MKRYEAHHLADVLHVHAHDNIASYISHLLDFLLFHPALPMALKLLISFSTTSPRQSSSNPPLPRSQFPACLNHKLNALLLLISIPGAVQSNASQLALVVAGSATY